MADTYEIEWRGETYHASDLTDELKKKYCKWLYRHMLTNAREYKTAAEFAEFDRKLTTNPPKWTSLPEHWDVIESFTTPEGAIALARLILGIKVEVMNDEELNEMIREKEKDPLSDYCVAMRQIKESADPKVQRGGHGSPAPADAKEPTPHSVTSQSA